MTLAELKDHILNSDLEEFVEAYIFARESPIFNFDSVRRVKGALSAKFSISADELDIIVVGSAKLGFGLMPKQERYGPELPRFRPFRADSDIDLAIVSPHLFETLWEELSEYANRAAERLPWNSRQLGDYMVHGWLRPDYFPMRERLRKCDDWWDLFRSLSSDSRLGRRRIRGGLYYAISHLRRYQLRGLTECRQSLEVEL